MEFEEKICPKGHTYTNRVGWDYACEKCKVEKHLALKAMPTKGAWKLEQIKRAQYQGPRHIDDLESDIGRGI